MKISFFLFLSLLLLKSYGQLDTNSLKEEIECTKPLYYKKDSSCYKIACYYKNDTAKSNFFQGIYSWANYKKNQKNGYYEVYYHEYEVPLYTVVRGRHEYTYQWSGKNIQEHGKTI